MNTQILPITGIPVGQIPPAVIVCGDPDRAVQVSNHLDEARLISQHREYVCYGGDFEGMPVAVCSHGIGAAGAAIAFEELVYAGGRQIVRVGTCGALQPGIRSGHLIIASASVMRSGYGREMVPEGYPAVADLYLTMALDEAAESFGQPYDRGIVLTRDAFYQGVDPCAGPDYQKMSEANVKAVEMECGALFIVGSLRGVQTGAILAVDGNVLESAESIDSYDPGQTSVKAAVEAEIES
ncbi:MAG: nucleoside phosphorylase, partial [Chloroflexota bacterium]